MYYVLFTVYCFLFIIFLFLPLYPLSMYSKLICFHVIGYYKGVKINRFKKQPAKLIRIRKRKDGRSYDMLCLECGGLTDKLSHTCSITCNPFLGNTNNLPSEDCITGNSDSLPRACSTPVISFEQGIGKTINIDWSSADEITSAFLCYLRGPQQEIRKERTLRNAIKQLYPYVRYLMTDKFAKEFPSHVDMPMPRKMVTIAFINKYMEGLPSKHLYENFGKFANYISLWLASSDPTKYIENTTELRKAQSKSQRQRLRDNLRRKLAKESITTISADTASLRICVLNGMAQNMSGVIERIHDGTTSPADILYMVSVLPVTILATGRPMRGVDMSFLTMHDAETLKEGKKLVLLERKETCKNALMYVPNNSCIIRVLQIYTKYFRPYLVNGRSHTPKTNASVTDIEYLQTFLQTNSEDQILLRMFKSRDAKSLTRFVDKYHYIFDECAPAGGWIGAKTARDLKTGWNSSVHNTMLIVGKSGSPHPNIGSFIKDAFEEYGNAEGMTVTLFRKLIETEEKYRVHGSDTALTNFACDHTALVADRHYVRDTRDKVLRKGSMWDHHYRLQGLSADLFCVPTSTSSSSSSTVSSRGNTSSSNTILVEATVYVWWDGPHSKARLSRETGNLIEG